MAKERAVLVITADPSIIRSLPSSVPSTQEVHVATSLEQAVLMYDDLALKLDQIYLDLRTPRVHQGRPGPFPDGASFIQGHLTQGVYRGPLFTIVDCNADQVTGHIERPDVGQTVHQFLHAPE